MERGKSIYFTRDELHWLKMSLENQDYFESEDHRNARDGALDKVQRALYYTEPNKEV